jgi:hypothetical protein
MNKKFCNTCNLELEMNNFTLRADTHKYRNNCNKCIHQKAKERYINREINLNEIKKCSNCKVEKKKLEFDICKSNKTGVISHCKQCISLKNKIDYENKKEKIKVKTLDYYYKNKTEIMKKRLIRQKERLKEDPKYRLTRNLRNRLYYALLRTEWKKNTKFSEYIGCSLDELKLHIEKQFKDNMSWDNYGDWEIDHIIPLDSAQTEEDLYKLCHFSNLQPLWYVDNIKKANKVLI